jgi:hypothetical protein
MRSTGSRTPSASAMVLPTATMKMKNGKRARKKR